jgi:hypothetical protein
MPTFWENVLRFPRFFISSIIGLFLVIFGPSLNLLRKPQTAIIFFAIFSYYNKSYVEFRIIKVNFALRNIINTIIKS